MSNLGKNLNECTYLRMNKIIHKPVITKHECLSTSKKYFNGNNLFGRKQIIPIFMPGRLPDK
jgi:hypothetical protein